MEYTQNQIEALQSAAYLDFDEANGLIYPTTYEQHIIELFRLLKEANKRISLLRENLDTLPFDTEELDLP